MGSRVPVTRLLRAIALWLALAAASASCAEDAAEFTVAANLGIASDYVSRGLGLNWERPALQGGAEWLHRDGWYVSAYFSQLTDNYYANGTVELDFYSGLRRSVSESLAYDIGVGAYLYPGANYRHAQPTGTYPARRYDTVEAIVGITWQWLNIKYSHCLTDYYGYDDRTAPVALWNSGVVGGVAAGKGTAGSGYLEANATFDLGQGFSSQLHVGRQHVAHSRNLSYSDFKVSATKTLPDNWSATLAVSTTHGADIYDDFLAVSGNGQKRDVGGTHWVFSVSKAF